MTPKQQAVIDALADSPLSAMQLSDITGYPSKSIDMVLAYLTAQEFVEVLPREAGKTCLYSLTTSGKASISETSAAGVTSASTADNCSTLTSIGATMTDDTKTTRRAMSDEAKAKIAATAQARKDAQAFIHKAIDDEDFVDTLKDCFEPEYVAVFLNSLKAATNYRPAKPLTPRKGSKQDKLAAIRQTLLDAPEGSVSEMDLFMRFKVGQTEMLWVRRQLATNLPDDQKMFIELVDDNWTVKGVGLDNEPEGFRLR